MELVTSMCGANMECKERANVLSGWCQRGSLCSISSIWRSTLKKASLTLTRQTSVGQFSAECLMSKGQVPKGTV